MGAVADVFASGNALQELCSGRKPGKPNHRPDLRVPSMSKYNSCIMYLAGFHDATRRHAGWGAANHKDDAPLIAMCIPTNAGPEQLRLVWLIYARGNPEKLHKAAVDIALKAFEETWPCNQ